MKLKSLSLAISTALLASGLFVSQAATAQGRLVVYCSATNILCETTTKAFGEKYDVKTSFIRNGSGSTFAKVEAEKNNPDKRLYLKPCVSLRSNLMNVTRVKNSVQALLRHMKDFA